jgi:hypothetical protein
MDRIGGPQNIREGLVDALANGECVTAKIRWLTRSSGRAPTSHAQLRGDQYTNSSTADTLAESEMLEGKPRWIHCTPLLGSDSKPGVIMVIMVDKEEITGSLNAGSRVPSRGPSRAMRSKDETMEGFPLKGLGDGSERYASAKLYAEYLCRAGQPGQESVDEPQVGEGQIPDDNIKASAVIGSPMGPPVTDRIVSPNPTSKGGLLSDVPTESQSGNMSGLNRSDERES